jgi:hypothetical protein
MKTIGQNIAGYRKEKGITQETLAEICSVTPQAVSKWENDVSYPDITLLNPLARAFGVSVDELLDDGSEPVTKLAAENPDTDKMLLRVRVRSTDGDKVDVNLPVKLIEIAVSNEALMSKLGGGGDKGGNWARSLDFNQILTLISLGVTGKLVEVQSADGDQVEVWVE